MSELELAGCFRFVRVVYILWKWVRPVVPQHLAPQRVRHGVLVAKGCLDRMVVEDARHLRVIRDV